MCDPGVKKVDSPQHGLFAGGTPVDCGQIGAENQFVGRAFYTYKFSVSPTVSLFNNAVQLTVLADGAYGKTNFETNGSGHSYDNSYLSRCECDPMFVAADRLGGSYDPYNDRSLFDASYWKLREVGARFALPESLASRVGAQRASLSISARELANLWVADADVAGLVVADPETSRARPGEANYRAMPPTSAINVALRVSF
jgi:hypothetical protein